MTNEVDPALTGAAFDLASAGYAPMKDPERKQEREAIDSDSGSLREAAGQLPADRDEVVTRQYADGAGKKAAANEAVTLARAARDYAEATAAERLAAEDESAKALADRVDALRAAALASDPDVAEFYGFDVPEAAADSREFDHAEADDRKVASKPVDGAADSRSSHLDPELEKALRHPQVLQAIEERVGEAEKARQSYRDGLAAATQIAQVSFLGQFPELAGVQQENLPAFLEQMSRLDPSKFARVKAAVGATEHLFAQQAIESQRHSEIAHRNFQKFADTEDARLDTMLKDEPKAVQQAVAAEIMASAKASGVDPAELLHLYNSEPLMRNAAFQRMMYDAGKYRLIMKARDAVAARPVPPVQRPGMATTRSERAHTDLRTLSARLSSTGDIKDAVALYRARRSNDS
jgi:hypothetical protein